MANNFQLVRKGRPGLGFQPKALPKPALKQLARQPVAALAEDAYPSSLHPRGMERWSKHSTRRQSQIGGIFGSGTIGQYPERGHRQHQPVPGYPLWMVRLECCHCQPTPLRARNPSSIQTRNPYQLTPASSGDRSVNTNQGSCWFWSQTTSKVPQRRTFGWRKAVPRPTQA